jgi:hypothetical protein
LWDFPGPIAGEKIALRVAIKGYGGMRQRSYLRSVAAFSAVLAIGLLASGCDWSQFGFGSSHDGDNGLDTTITPANVSMLAPKFAAVTNSIGPVAAEAVVNGVLYAASYSLPSWLSPTLYAFGANGTTGCGGTPIMCTPLWTASLGSAGGSFNYNVAVAKGVLYVNGGPGLEAFDAAGHTNCSGSPVVCQPLWQASVDWANGVPTVANGTVFVTVQGGDLEAFDASGATNCSGSPQVCSPIWVSHILSASAAITVSNGIAYAQSSSGGTYGTVVAVDAAGKTGCSGTPKVCTPMWEYALTDLVTGHYVSVSGSTLYVGTGRLVSLHPVAIEGYLMAYDANGANGCSGVPKICSAIWTNAFPSSGPPVVGEGLEFAPPFSGTSLAAFDANGSKKWTSSIAVSPLSIGGSVLYAGDAQNVYAFDATGSVGCSVSVCSPLWTTGRPGNSVDIQNAIIANATLYVTTQDSAAIGEVLAYSLP